MVVDTEYLRSRIEEVREVVKEIKGLMVKRYPELSLNEKYSLRYHIIVLAEALGSLCLHLALESFGREPRSYPECFKLLEEKGFIDCAEDLIKMARLRNILVHRYWTVDDEKAYNSVKKNFKCVEYLIENVKNRYGI